MEPVWLYKASHREAQSLSTMPWPGQQGPLVLLLLTHSLILTAAHSYMSDTPAHMSTTPAHMSATPAHMSAKPAHMSAKPAHISAPSDMSSSQDWHSHDRLLFARR